MSVSIYIFETAVYYFPKCYFRSPRHTPSDLSNSVLGSEKEGGFVQLPSFGALESQLGKYNPIIVQVCVVSSCACVFAPLFSSAAFQQSFSPS